MSKSIALVLHIIIGVQQNEQLKLNFGGLLFEPSLVSQMSDPKQSQMISVKEISTASN